MYIFREKQKKNHKRGRVTIIGVYKDGALFLSASKNHPKFDSFDKQEGRWRALERLIKGDYAAIELLAECDGKKFVEIASSLARLIANGTRHPIEIKGPKEFYLKDFLNSPVVPKEKKEAYLRQNETSDNIPLDVPAVQ